MRATILLLLTLLASFATAAPAPVALELTGCHYVESLDSVPAALVDPLVPDEFQMGGVVSLIAGMATCDARASDGREDVVTFGWADVSVSPRAALRAPGITLYLYRIEHVVTDDLYRELHAAIGAECRVADAAQVSVSLAGTRASASDAEGAMWDILVPAAPEESLLPTRTPYREFGPAPGGYAYLQGTLVDPGSQAVPGVFLADDDSALAATRGPAWPSRTQAGSAYAIEGTTIGFVASARAPAPRETC